MSSASSPRRPDRAARPSRTAKDEGPRASLRQLLPFVFEHKKTLIAVAILSVLAAAATLAQPASSTICCSAPAPRSSTPAAGG